MGEKKTGRKRKILLFLVTNLIAAACLVWSLRGAELHDLPDDLRRMSWGWIVVAVISDIAVYCWHGLRWSLLLQPLAPVSFRKAIQAVYVGLFTNEVLPFRLGELVRCYLIGRWYLLPFSVTISSAIIERVFDGIWLSLCLVVMLMYVDFPPEQHYFVVGGYVVASVALGLAVLLILGALKRERVKALLPGIGWQLNIRVMLDDLYKMGRSRYLYLSFFQSLPYLLISTIPIYAALRGYQFELGWGVAFAVMVILRLGSVVPQAPGNIGFYQACTIASLVHILGAVDDVAAAKRFALVLWAIVTIPLLLGGLIAVLITEDKIGDLTRAAQAEVGKEGPVGTS
ncbi:MAG TPA: lysylphosphatidylglycerol synthase transmembrane domain-containing protein [Bryobacteraceae bacterium]|nr:lysylphosphatidylglycerol synthase transmembrane domain-containing protein [Bryobacteraceae bacterium]